MWTRELADKISPSLVLVLRRTPRDRAKSLVAGLGLSPVEQEAALGLCPVEEGPAPNLSTWMAAAWLCGASYRQLARLHSRHFSTIRDRIKALLPSNASRLDRAISEEILSIMWRLWQDRCHKLDPSTPITDIATQLKVATTLDEPPPPDIDWCA